MRLFHFSEDPSIRRFEPRPVRVPAERPVGRAWLNGPLVWAIDEVHQGLYLFPRECPRILLWTLAASTEEDAARWGAPTRGRMAAHVEEAWMESVRSARLYRYELPAGSFESLEDAGMWVSREPVEPLAVEAVEDLPAALLGAGVELAAHPDLGWLQGAWASTLHVSGIRLRNARNWRPVRPPAPAGEVTVRLARAEDAEALPGVEDSAGELFRGLPDLSWVAEDVSAPPAFYAPLIEAGLVWVGDHEAEGVAGFLCAEPFGPELHVWTLAVHRGFQRHGLGRRLMAAAAEHARAAGLEALTLTTFRHVPWNGPFYASLGFRSAAGERLGAILRQEAARGLPDRIAMRLQLQTDR